MDQNQSQRCEALLSVNYEFLAFFVANDDGTKEVMTIPFNCTTFVTRFVALFGIFLSDHQ